MSTNPLPEGSAGTGPHPGPPPQASSDFFGWIRGLGVVRGPDRWAGGVASGVAHRWGVNPLLVRGLFVVAAVFLGVGLLAYGLLWMFLPEPDGRIHAESAVHGHWTAGMTGGLVSAVLGLGGAPTTVWLGDARWTGPLWTVVWVGVVFLIVYAISTSRRRERSPGAFDAAQQPSAAGMPQAPVGMPAAPMAPAVPRHPSRPGPGGPYTAVVLGSAVVVIGVLLALQLAGIAVIDPSGGVLWGIGAAIIGLGIIVAGLRGRAGGILSLFAVIALVSGALAQPAYDLGRTENTTTSSPTSVQQAAQGYTLTGTSAQLDLRALDDAGSLAADATVPVTATLSSLRISIPKNVPVKVTADGALSTVNFGGKTSSGIALSDAQTYNAGRPGATLTVTLHATLSNVEIEQEQ